VCRVWGGGKHRQGPAMRQRQGDATHTVSFYGYTVCTRKCASPGHRHGAYDTTSSPGVKLREGAPSPGPLVAVSASCYAPLYVRAARPQL